MKYGSVRAPLATVAFIGSLLAPQVSPAALPRNVQLFNAPTVYQGSLPSGRAVRVTANGLAMFADMQPGRRSNFTYRRVSSDVITELRSADMRMFGINALMQIDETPGGSYIPGRVLVVLKDRRLRNDVETVGTDMLLRLRASSASSAFAMLAPRFTDDLETNAGFARVGVDRAERIGHGISPIAMETAVSRARATRRGPRLDISGAVVLHITNASVPNAVRALSTLSNVAYASPDYRIGSTGAAPLPLPKAVEQATQHPVSSRFGRSGMLGTTAGPPVNFGIASNLQAYLNSPGIDALAAYDEIMRRFNQLPGTGEIITNVSLGDVTDASEISNTNDACAGTVSMLGPTTHLIGGQHFLDIPSMPLIPTFTSDDSGALSSTGTVCGVDAALGEVLLDFTMMSGLPSDQQRAGERGSGLTDLLGIAPGAQYRLIVPSRNHDFSLSSLLGSFLGAVAQSPPPNVITASVAFTGAPGFADRFLEDDPLFQSAVSTIVNGDNIVVCIASGDGLRDQGSAVNPSGGSTATNLATSAATTTSLNDLFESTAPSQDLDSGAISVGGTTLDDISAANPYDPNTPPALAGTRTFAETRWTGFQTFSSTFGTRVNISAPSDNILSIVHKVGSFDSVTPVLQGGTSAAAPMTAAAAAIAMQVARLTGHPFTSATAVRDFLVANATPVAAIPQADIAIPIGPQLNVRRVVESLIGSSGTPQPPPLIGRIAIMQRNSGPFATNVDFSQLGSEHPNSFFTENVSPALIDLAGPLAPGIGASDWDLEEPITIAPDWENLPAGAQVKLFVTGHPDRVLSTALYARLLPPQILTAAGLSVASSSERQISLTYQATLGFHPVVRSSFTLNFGPSDAVSKFFFAAPSIPPVVTGTTIPVTYDVSNESFGAATLVVSAPGRMQGYSNWVFTQVYTQPLTQLKGSVLIPVSALKGGGIYGVSIEFGSGQPTSGIIIAPGHPTTDIAYTRVTAGSARPAAPLLSLVGSATPPGHNLTIPVTGGSITVKYDISNVPNATGGIVEFSAPAVGALGTFDTFNNPNGTGIDNDGFDSGSVSQFPISGSTGTLTVTSSQAKLAQGHLYTVRIDPVCGTNACGEDGELSSIIVPEFDPPDGGNMAESAGLGFAIDPTGTDLIYGSGQPPGGTPRTFGRMDQNTGAAAQFTTFVFGSLGIVGNDIAYLHAFTPSSSLNVFPSFASTPTSSVGTTFLLPTGGNPNLFNFGQVFTPTSTSSTKTAILDENLTVGGTAANEFIATEIDLSKSTAVGNTLVNMGAPIASSPGAALAGFDFDPTTNAAYLVADTFNNSCQQNAAFLLRADFNNGTVSSLGLPAEISGFALDSTTHIGLAPEACGGPTGTLLLFDLSSSTPIMRTVSVPTNGNFTPEGVAVDSVNHLFLLEQSVSDDLFSNNNSQSSVIVVDETGNIVEKLENFSFSPSFQDHDILTNNRRTGFLLNGTGNAQSFSY